MKKIAAICVTSLFVTGCVSPAEARPLKMETKTVEYNGPTPLIDHIVQKEEISIRTLTLNVNTNKVESAISQLEKHVGKTWYVFSGNTPSGWDCSGLTMWFYSKLGFDLEHRASKQAQAGIKTSDPKPGDLVVFRYNKSKNAYHVGVYIGDGKMIHAPRKGQLTRIESVESFGGNYSKVEYRRFLETS